MFACHFISGPENKCREAWRGSSPVARRADRAAAAGLPSLSRCAAHRALKASLVRRAIPPTKIPQCNWRASCHWRCVLLSAVWSALVDEPQRAHALYFIDHRHKAGRRFFLRMSECESVGDQSIIPAGVAGVKRLIFEQVAALAIGEVHYDDVALAIFVDVRHFVNPPFVIEHSGAHFVSAIGAAKTALMLLSC